MPIYNYACTFCGARVERYLRFDKAPPCPECTGFMVKVPSTPGYRRDHTISENK